MPELASGMPDGRAVLLRAVAGACKPRHRLTVSEWADANRVLTSKSAQLAGHWRTERTPYAREIMDALSVNSPVSKVVVMAAIQMLKTEVCLNFTGYIIDHDPGPLLSVQPTLEMRDRYVLQRVAPMIEAAPCLSDKLNVKLRKSDSNSRDVKDFPGGIAVFSGANSPSSLRSMPVKYLILDEVDSFPWDVGKGKSKSGEGDPIGLLEGRQSNFTRRKTLEVSSPTIKGVSVIDADFERGDMRRYHVPCPYCGELQVLKFQGGLQWTVIDGCSRDVHYQCAHCNAAIEEYHKPTMLAEAGRGGRARWIAENRDAPFRSYHINALYSPIGLGLSWEQLANEWLSSHDNPVKLKRFVNTRLAEAWEDLSRNLQWQTLAERAEDYALKAVPPGALVLTAGIDTQNDRLAIEVVGWGRNDTAWIIDYLEIPGDPFDQVEAFLQKKGALYDYLAQPFENAWGKPMRIQAAGWDTGGQRTDAIYRAVRSRVVSRLVALKGASTYGKPILSPRPSYQDVTHSGRIIKRGVALWTVGTDTAKDAIAAHLGADAERVPEDRHIRFSNQLDEGFYKMLLAEKFDPEKNRWIKPPGRRNEALDCLVYATAASRHPELRIHLMSKAAWDNLEKQLQPGEHGKDASEPEQEAPKAAPKPKPRRGGGGFGSDGWKDRGFR